jgi:hypothetical protein
LALTCEHEAESLIHAARGVIPVEYPGVQLGDAVRFVLDQPLQHQPGDSAAAAVGLHPH